MKFASTHATRLDYNVLARVYAGIYLGVVCALVGLTCIKIHRTGKIYFPVSGKLEN